MSVLEPAEIHPPIVTSLQAGIELVPREISRMSLSTLVCSAEFLF